MGRKFSGALRLTNELLQKLQKSGHLQSGISKEEFKKVLAAEVKKPGEGKINFYLILLYLLSKNLVKRLNLDEPHMLRFNVARIEIHLAKQSAGGSEGNASARSGASPEKSHPQEKQPRKSKGELPLPFYITQRKGFRLGERVSAAKSRDAPAQDATCCYTCNKKYSSQLVREEHEKTDEHTFLAMLRSNPQSSGVSISEKQFHCVHGVFVKSIEGEENKEALAVNVSDSDISPTNPTKVVVKLEVCYDAVKEGEERRFQLEKVFLVFGNPDTCIITNNARPMVLKDKPAQYQLTFLGKEVGRSEYMVVFKLIEHINEAGDTGPQFFVMKKISLRVDNEATKEDGAPVFSVPVVHQRVADTMSDLQCLGDPTGIVEEGERPENPSGLLKYVVLLKEYPFPAQYRQFFNSGFKKGAKEILDKEKMFEKYTMLSTLVEGMKENTHEKFLSLLLFLEEHQTVCDLRSYSLKNTPITKSKQNGKLLSINVPGLAENRPSVLKGDAIFITVPNSGIYKGWVHQIRNTQIHTKFGQKFMSQFIDNQKFTVDFSFNRFCFRLEHRAVEFMNEGGKMNPILFPKAFGKFPKNSSKPKWINGLVAKNPEQAQAVQNIVNGTSLPAPYLLFGPPGTGKTVTLVEAIKQLKKCTNFYLLGGEAQFPPKGDLERYRVIVCTLICAGRLVSGGLRKGHFSHIFIDECGHGMEPTCLVPVAGLLDSEPNPGQLVLSGDPRQLGPVIRSPVAKSLGLDQSLLERLMLNCELYQKQEDGKYNALVLTKLVRNFRSHPTILKVPNQLFYDGELQYLKTKGVPLIVHGVEGKDEQDEGSPSFFNIAEVNQVVQYVEKIFDSKFCGQKLRPTDIGIISPYRRQITKIHRALERKKIEGLSVGSVEEFQGQERRVIIVSTVRSDPAQLSLDQKFRLGFVREPKRFNVAVTRAKSLLIVVGNPNILQQDPNWRCLLELAINIGGYTGVRFELSTPDDPLRPLNLDELRVPVKEKLVAELALTKAALRATEPADIENIIQQMQDVTLVQDVSETEQMVSPAFTSNREQ
ncbi:hypothetical protein B566_EDAN004906 [Ephemera danica]|nr:hypothetical protein B566_EDAN004906 [Ephemera danica]